MPSPATWDIATPSVSVGWVFSGWKIGNLQVGFGQYMYTGRMDWHGKRVNIPSECYMHIAVTFIYHHLRLASQQLQRPRSNWKQTSSRLWMSFDALFWEPTSWAVIPTLNMENTPQSPGEIVVKTAIPMAWWVSPCCSHSPNVDLGSGIPCNIFILERVCLEQLPNHVTKNHSIRSQMFTNIYLPSSKGWYLRTLRDSVFDTPWKPYWIPLGIHNQTPKKT